MVASPKARYTSTGYFRGRPFGLPDSPGRQTIVISLGPHIGRLNFSAVEPRLRVRGCSDWSRSIGLVNVVSQSTIGSDTLGGGDVLLIHVKTRLRSSGDHKFTQSSGGACTSIFLSQQMGRSWPSVQ